jgi:hypothetical protein
MVGWFIRAKMRDDATANSPERIAERLRHRAACDAARADREREYPVLTADNAQEAIDFQERRIREILEETADDCP